MRPDAKVIPHVVFFEEIDDIEHFAALSFGVIQLDERRHYVLPGICLPASGINHTE
jgi:hypothetical protein